VNTTTDTPAALAPVLPAVGERLTVCGITGTVQTVEPASDWSWTVVLLVTDGGGAGVTMTLVIPTDSRTDDGQPAYGAQPARRCTSCDGLGTVAACGCGRPESDRCDRGDAIGCPDCAEGWAYTPAERPALTGDAQGSPAWREAYGLALLDGASRTEAAKAADRAVGVTR
jgi:hypothetical protein